MMRLNASLRRQIGRHASPPAGGRRFPVLEGLRGVSALAVVFFHLRGWGAGVFRHGYLAVDLFFVISGFVIAHAYEARLKSGWSPRAFMGVRVRRLAPLYLAGAMLGAIVALFAHSQGFGGDGPVGLNLALALLFIPALFGGGELYPLNAPSWSLLAELCANLVYGAVARTLSRATLIALASLGAVAVAMVTLRSGLGANLGVSSGNWIGGLARVAFGFPAGVILFRLQAAGRLRVPRLPAGLALAIAAASFAAPVDGPIYDLAVILGLYPLLVAAAVESPIGGHRTAATFAAAGAVSYPLYALHYPLAKLAGTYLPAMGPAAVITLASGLALLAYGALKLFDEPVQAALKAAASRPPKAPVAGASAG